MLIHDSIRVIDPEGKVLLPSYLRVALSLKSGTRVSLCAVPFASDRASCELIISPVRFDVWCDLWKIDVAFRDRPGVVARFLRCLEDCMINVCTEESSSIESRSIHTLQLLTDCSRYTGDGGTESRRQTPHATLADLRSRLLATCIDDIIIEPMAERPHVVQLTITRMEGLFSAWRNHRATSEAGRPVFPVVTAVLQKGYLTVPQALTDPLRLYLQLQTDSNARIVFAANTRERLVRGYLPSTREALVYARIAHHDEIGALAKITTSLREQGLDIVTSFTRIQKQGETNHFELLLASGRGTITDTDGIKVALHGALSSKTLASLNLRLAYPENVATALEGTAVEPIGPAITLTAERSGRIAEVVANAINDLQNRAQRDAGADERIELNAKLGTLKDLHVHEALRTVLPNVFASYDFKDPRTWEVARRHLGEFRIVTGEDPAEKQRFRDTIIDRIRSADGFIGIWTRRSDGYFSPWLLWELGVAMAYRLPVVLVVHEEVTPAYWSRIIPEQHHWQFNDRDFVSRLNGATRTLSGVLKGGG